jgi:hypothetical protein
MTYNLSRDYNRFNTACLNQNSEICDTCWNIECDSQRYRVDKRINKFFHPCTALVLYKEKSV